MKRVFVSSVIKGFEPFRAAAKAAIELMGHVPAMSEALAARAYSSRQACLTEVERSDLYILVLGSKFGFEAEAGVCATQAEFRHAGKLNKPILLFVQDVEMEPEQAEFCKEVENFHTGFFRASFSTPDQLKDQIVRGLRQLEQAASAAPKERFLERIEAALETRNRSYGSRDAELLVGFLPQPEVRVHLPEVEAGADALFSKLCAAGLAALREGYKLEGAADVVSVRSGTTELSIFQDGLHLVRLRPRPPDRDGTSFDYVFVPPSYVRGLATAVFDLFDANSGWCHIALEGMEHHVMRERPSERVTSISMPMRSDGVAQEHRLFQPLTRPAYDAWIKQVVESFTRHFRV